MSHPQPPGKTPSQQLLRFFSSGHLPGPLRDYAQPVEALAHWVENNVPDGPEKTAGLRKLLEAKDCFVRAALPDE
jgi:hypothetical protein